MKPVTLKGKERNVCVGDECLIAVNSNIGANSSKYLFSEKKKIDTLFYDVETTPDTMMDLSVHDYGEESLYKYIIDKYGIPVGVVPIYTLYSAHQQLEDDILLNRIENLAQSGVSFMTMHFTADNDILDIAKKSRKIPVTSRGGGIVLKENYGKGSANIYRQNIDNIATLALKYGFTISLGTTFRPASVVDACDEAHIKETKRQIEVCRYLQSIGVSVMMENVGHIGVDRIASHSKLLKEANAPIMPLGPSTIDSAVGQDHVAAAIGAAFMGYFGVAHIINSLSPSEHQNSFFTIQDAVEAVKAAKVAAQSVNSILFQNALDKEINVYCGRASHKSCVIEGEIYCERCSTLCPIKLIRNED